MYKKLEFEFNDENKCRAKEVLSMFPEKEIRGAVIPILDLAQRQHGWLPITAIHKVAEMLKMEPFVVWEVANFYTMFKLKPQGKYCLKVCTTTPCFLRGSDELLQQCKSTLKLENNETSKDMQFTLTEWSCLGACVNAPILQVNDDLYEDLDAASLAEILKALQADRIPPPGPRGGRYASEPSGGLTSLNSEPPPAGFGMQNICKQLDKDKKKECK
ncbi:CG6485 [Drosophila busckii]|uniref:CG6485 n=2 Tax=Drosophila busckii TaxID=30019 RepID=A0A0M3QWZ2_DROBS|nr:CG6485 [Drosophila busckii]